MRRLGQDFEERFAEWNLQQAATHAPTVPRLLERSEPMLSHISQRTLERGAPTEHEGELVRDLLLFVLFHRFLDQLPGGAPEGIGEGSHHGLAKTYEGMREYAKTCLAFGNAFERFCRELPHLFACLCQMRRAFTNIFQFIVGVSRPAVVLRATVWQSIFTRDVRRYSRILFDRMGDYTTLVMGPSGTGKELVARAVGFSRLSTV